MMIIMEEEATPEQIDLVVKRVESIGAHAQISTGELLTVIGAIGDQEHVANLQLEGYAGVDRVVPIVKPYKLASRQFKHDEDTILQIAGPSHVATIGGNNFSLIAGPCTVESRDQLAQTAAVVKAEGAAMLRGGAYKPRTSPYSFQGLGEEGLELLAEARGITGLPIITELMDVRDLEKVAEVADVIQVGARNMQNYNLLTEIGKSDCAVLLKRGFSATIEDLLMASEYVLKEGNENVMLCERGIRTFETSTRFTIDILAVPVLKKLSHLPVVVDPSHATGSRDLVLSASLAAVAAGADGVIVEIHPDPANAICDGPQAIPTNQFAEYVRQVKRVCAAVDKKFS